MKLLNRYDYEESEFVRNWREIQKEAEEMREFMKNTTFKGLYPKAFALSHTQVSDTPKRFFIISEEEKYGLVKIFRHWCIINLIILEREDEVDFKEACMAFPYRKPKWTPRYRNIKVRYYIPFWRTWRPITQKLSELPAYICQHENSHAHAQNIYGK